MRVAVTGASGFLGRHVLLELKKQSVTATAILRPGSARSTSLESALPVYLDVLNPPLNAFEVMGGPEVLIHLAWGGLPNYTSPHHVEEQLPAQNRFLELLIKSGLGALVVAGTCFEYGMQFGPLHEAMEPKPVTPYGLAKDRLRQELEVLRATCPFILTWARIFYMYGEGQPASSLMSQLKSAVTRGEKVFNMSGGEQLRDYLPVEEVARYLVALAQQGRDNGIVNICSGTPISVRGLVEGWVRQSGSGIKLNLGYYPYLEYEPMAFWGDRAKLDRASLPLNK
ncbi:MAG: NAD-dependent epimerase/dehydratase family protein [Gemmatimonadota bacterium]|nr:NAD-dependent epimerase/dehydratase family protein [Gemmatimonadota bacterium]